MREDTRGKNKCTKQSAKELNSEGEGIMAEDTKRLTITIHLIDAGLMTGIYKYFTYRPLVRTSSVTHMGTVQKSHS